MLNHIKSVGYGFFVPSTFWFCARRQVGFSGRYFLDTYSLALEVQRIASINSQLSARLGGLAQSAI